MTIQLGFLRSGDTFLLDGKRYKAGHVIDGTPEYVACTDIVTKKVTRLHIDTDVEVER